MHPIAYPDASVANIKGLEKSGCCNKVSSHNFCFNITNATCFSFQSKAIFFFKWYVQGLAILEKFEINLLL